MQYEPLAEPEEVLSSTVNLNGEGASAAHNAEEHFTEQARQARMQMAMFEVMDGAVARGRSLKYWENLRLKPIHMQMLLMKAAGFKNRKIAEQLGYDEGRVSVIVNHPDAMYLLSHLVSFQAEGLLDINARMQAHAGEALDTALMLLRGGKEEVREKVAFKLLDRAGYGAIKKVESTVKFEMPLAQATAITAALQESDDVEDMDDADFLVLESGPVGEPGSSEGEVDSFVGTFDHDVPPIVEQQVPTHLSRRIA